ncbi:U6 snRNA phosphodiesterase 1 [Anticarsia gemmatalis]|uniref:U6 snRNA phosphodiesterase 1 n=1 Tax=Anticarsia gemmatalis TaxID=129554 RepID=UPI003F75F2BD
MSALAYISEYGSNSDDSDSEFDNIGCMRTKLPTPNLSKVAVVPVYEHQDDPQLHDGRIRSFPHVRGNWATFVFIQYLESDALHDLLDKLQEKILSVVESCQKCNDFHISLSMTVVLKYHLISSFRTSLQSSFNNIKSFDLGFAAVKVYCNEENSRTFISLDVDPFTHKFLKVISKKVDQAFEEYQLPTFYEDPSFHMSVLWVKGNKKTELNNIIESLNEILFQETENSLKNIFVETISCKVGNKYFQYTLT